MHPAWQRCSSLTYLRVCSLLAPCQTGASAPKNWEFIFARTLTGKKGKIKIMDLALEVLEWAKDKKDLAEVYYENKSGSAPVAIRLVFDAASSAPSSGGKKFAYVHSPTIGALALNKEKVALGSKVTAGDSLGQVSGDKEMAQITVPLSGRVVEVLSRDGAGVGFGEPLVLLEI